MKATAGVETATHEQRLLTALIRQAIVDSRAGDVDAADWLIHDASPWLVYVVPGHCDVGAVHDRIQRHADVEAATADAG